MKKILSIFAIAAMFAVACNKDDDKDNGNDNGGNSTTEYAGPEQGTSAWSVIGSLAEEKVAMNWDNDLVMAASGDLFVLKNLKLTAADEFKIRENKDWGNNRGGDFVELGSGFAVNNGGNNIKPGLDGLYDIYYNPAAEQMAVCAAGKTPEWGYIPAIAIDGKFDDWAALGNKAVSAKNAEGSNWDAVKEIRCYADEVYVFYYIEFDSDLLAEQMAEVTGETNCLPIRLNINTDGEFTSGYTSYSLDGYDFIIEGSLAENKAWTSFDGTLHQRIGSWNQLQENGLCSGAGEANHYEICLMRDAFNAAAATSSVPMPMGEVFQTGIRFYTPSWGELSNMPNTTPNPDSEVSGEQKGWGHLLEVHTVMFE